MINVEKCLWCSSHKLSPFSRRKDGVGIVKCEKCQLIMVDQIPEDLDEYYYQESYYNDNEANLTKDTGYGEMYDLMAPAFLFWQNSLIEELNENHTKKKFLEIGSATGNLLEIIRDNQENLTLKGIDISRYAVKATQEKGFDAEVAYIDKYNPKEKMDIIFSSETLEHLDDLKSFLKGVANNLKDEGTFLFYVPSISEADAKTDENYVRFNTNLEHLLHFTPNFFEKELKEFFQANVLIKEFITGFGPCIVGAVSKNPKNLENLTKMFTTLETEEIPDGVSKVFLKNLAVIALKFGQFELAEKAFGQAKKNKGISKKDTLLIQGLLGYHNGELVKSNASFEAYLKAFPGSQFAIKSLLSNERELSRIYLDEIYTLTRQLNKLENVKDLERQLFEHEAELSAIKNSRVFGRLLKFRSYIGPVLNPLINQKKK